MRAVSRSKRTRSEAGVRLHFEKQACAPSTARAASSGVALWWTPTTWRESDGFTEVSMSPVENHSPPMLRAYSRPNSERTRARAVSMAWRLAGTEKSAWGSLRKSIRGAGAMSFMIVPARTAGGTPARSFIPEEMVYQGELERQGCRPIPIHSSRRCYGRAPAHLSARLRAAGRRRPGSGLFARQSGGEHRTLAGRQFVVLVGGGAGEPGGPGSCGRGGGAQEQRGAGSAGGTQWNPGASERGRSRAVQTETAEGEGNIRGVGAGAGEDSVAAAFAGSGGERRHRVPGRR